MELKKHVSLFFLFNFLCAYRYMQYICTKYASNMHKKYAICSKYTYKICNIYARYAKVCKLINKYITIINKNKQHYINLLTNYNFITNYNTYITLLTNYF